MEELMVAAGPQTNAASGLSEKYLTFVLQNEEYGIGIRKVREIIGLMNITPLPQTPEFVKGVINLRGKVIPVVDLRSRFGMPLAETTDRTCIIVVEVDKDRSTIPVGILVDEVSEVLHIRSCDIDLTPSFGVQLDTAFILGMARTGENVKVLLDIDCVLTANGFGQWCGAREDS